MSKAANKLQQERLERLKQEHENRINELASRFAGDGPPPMAELLELVGSDPVAAAKVLERIPTAKALELAVPIPLPNEEGT